MRRHPIHDIARHGYTFAPDIEARFKRIERRRRAAVVFAVVVIVAAVAAWRL